ncbi:MAG: UxaA family hydrolase, partial [Pseudomonadota bacterium]
MSRIVRLAPEDDVATALETLSPGDEGATERIPRGHKLALAEIPASAPVRKYAQLIGYASADIPAGAHVHTHNLDFRAVDTDYAFATTHRPAPQPARQDSFLGYRRPSGRVGTRNFIAVITSVNCSATAASQIAGHFTPERLAPYPNVDGVTALVHGTGCGMAVDGDGFDALQR